MTVAVVALPPMTDFGAAIDTDVTVGGVTVSGAVFVTAPNVAEIVAVTDESSATVVTGNVAVVAPAATVADAGTVIPAATLSLESVIVVPPVGAGLEIVTVPAAPAPPSTLAGEADRLNRVGAVIVSVAVPVRTPAVAVTVAVVFAATGMVFTVNDAVV